MNEDEKVTVSMPLSHLEGIKTSNYTLGRVTGIKDVLYMLEQVSEGNLSGDVEFPTEVPMVVISKFRRICGRLEECAALEKRK